MRSLLLCLRPGYVLSLCPAGDPDVRGRWCSVRDLTVCVHYCHASDLTNVWLLCHVGDLAVCGHWVLLVPLLCAVTAAMPVTLLWAVTVSSG